MNIFENINETSGKMADAGEVYVKKSQEYLKLKIFQQISVSITLVTKAIVIGGLLFIALFFTSFSMALALGQWLGNLALGYLIIAVVFVIATGIAYYNRRLINKKVISSLSSKFFES